MSFIDELSLPKCTIERLVSMVVWRSGSVLVLINEVNLHQAQLVLGWVTMSKFNSQCGTFISITSHPGQLSLAILFILSI